MQNPYVVKGPTRIGNIMGYFGKRVPEGTFVIVVDDVYANGGFGPCTVNGTLYDTRQRAEAAAEAWSDIPDAKTLRR